MNMLCQITTIAETNKAVADLSEIQDYFLATLLRDYDAEHKALVRNNEREAEKLVRYLEDKYGELPTSAHEAIKELAKRRRYMSSDLRNRISWGMFHWDN